MDANLKQEFTTAIAAIEKIRATIEARECQAEEMPSAVLDASASDLCTCDACGIEIAGEEALFRIAEGLCYICAEHFEDSLKYYTEEFAHASAHGKDALRLLILRQRADNCRDTIAYAAASYDGDLEAHEASVERKMLDKRAAECLARLPPSFAPWWKDTWTHEKWCQIGHARETTGWALASKDIPIVQRLAAMFLTEQATVCQMKKVHAEALTNIERARTEDLEAVEGRHQREMAAAKDGCEKKCHDAHRKGYAMGYAFADQKATKAFEAMRADLERLSAENKGLRQKAEEDEQMVQRHLKEVAKGHAEATAWEKEEIERLRKDVRAHEARVAWHADMAKRDMEAITEGHAEIKKLEAQVEALHEELKREVGSATELFQAMRGDLERLNAENKGLRHQIEEDKKMVQSHLKEIAKENAEITAWETQRLREENKALQKKHDALFELVEPTVKLMKSNPEHFGGEALPRAVAPGEARGTSSPRPSAIVTQWRPVSEEETERAEKFLKALEAKGTSSPRPPAIVRLPLIKEEDKQRLVGASNNLVPRYCGVVEESPPTPLPGIVAAEQGLCEVWTVEETSAPEPVAEAAPETTRVCCVGCGKPKPNYNHPNWPSPITKRFAKHLAKHSGNTDPKSIRTHEDALEYIAKRGNISVETLLQWTMKHFQSFSQPWTLVEGPSKFVMGTAPATWWC